MKRTINWIIFFIIIMLLAFGFYRIFLDCDKICLDLNSKFELKINDYAKIDMNKSLNRDDYNNNDKLYIKLMKTTKKDCVKKECYEKDTYDAKVIILDDRHLSYVTLEKNKPIEIKKYDCIINMLEASQSKITLEVKEREKDNETI